LTPLLAWLAFLWGGRYAMARGHQQESADDEVEDVAAARVLAVVKAAR
jgi:hypothetical protein